VIKKSLKIAAIDNLQNNLLAEDSGIADGVEFDTSVDTLRTSVNAWIRESEKKFSIQVIELRFINLSSTE